MIVKEGLASVYSSSDTTSIGPGVRGPGFYNAEQRLNRDITLALLSVLKPKRYLDGFGGTGIRAIRAALELSIDSVVSDINRKSFSIIEDNVKRNNASVEVINGRFESVVSSEFFDFIDVDPYGSIVPYVDVSLNYATNRGFIGFTATDLSSLTGSIQKKTFRRYGAHIINDRLRHEKGIRLLIAFIAKRAAAQDKAVIPIISFWNSHYYRVIVQVKKGASISDRTLDQISIYNKKKNLLDFYDDVDEGPMWLGNISSVKPDVEIEEKYVDSDALQLIRNAEYENIMPLFYELSDVASYLHIDVPRIDYVKEYLMKEFGIESRRTRFSPTGIKYNGPGDRILKASLKLSSKK
ncbi:MAG: N2,N2-dimethylguanosine tRNA methyltransferase [Candidatus Thermoplasmatota archaeon]|nr:N2,N2-dimethylguanosine tRNA methyltransferase [Candidatus Thermoplasmatota archaeon]